MAAGFAVLIWIAVRTYQIGPPIPEKVVDAGGNTLFTGADVTAGQQVFLKHGLMDNGTLWGHGAYMGPDFSAAYLHQLALDAGDILAQRNFHRAGAELAPSERAALTGQVRELLSKNRYDARTRTLAFTDAEAASYRKQIGQWRDYFAGSRASRGLPAGTISDPEELRQLTSFFSWAAWAETARVPGKSYSYTNNFPYEPAIGNGPSSDAVLWSALSLIALLAGTAAVLFAFGRFDYLGWSGRKPHIHPELLPGGASRDAAGDAEVFRRRLAAFPRAGAGGRRAGALPRRAAGFLRVQSAVAPAEQPAADVASSVGHLLDRDLLRRRRAVPRRGAGKAGAARPDRGDQFPVCRAGGGDCGQPGRARRSG